ncbi:MAG: imidazole glycerol phosphate synthase, glutamine amidotransferase subunit [Sphingomonas sp. SCN 67-18]|uniref:imidazole glycerol phosphate synthase subunit HisH n=1 Tax=uncultured Sphingomonas sp. TaxID=158754 RepID=UPI00086B4B45|nr:imidazole glycerol phosphate synthase subunit HisH [Sphingomonas sp. SCN 67-18]ODU21962.1 MAG: imidazole glycerol phosphate synthase, glutamine amidotransferase subunit [Sphingomonas sp. SCN 67-18]
MSDTVALIDYGAGNLKSVHNALNAAGAGHVRVTADSALVAAADRIVLPGVGAFAACMNALAAIPGMVEALNAAAVDKGRPFLGICVGMQLLADRGEEYGVTPGLGWIGGTVRAIVPDDPAVKVPHMGWNDVTPSAAHPLIVPGEAYFLHSYAFWGDGMIATTRHGGPLTAAIGRDNIVGVQFHPEKSQGYGLDFLTRFLEWRP